MRNTPLVELTGKVAPLLRANVDTDAIIPSRSRVGVNDTDFSRFLFGEWRFTDDGVERADFVLNRPDRRDSVFLVALDNFGCGSSREPAAWALRDFGIRCIIAPSFGSIFQSNCYRNGVAPIVLDRDVVERLGAACEADSSLILNLDLNAQTVKGSDGFEARFNMSSGMKLMLLEGLDAIALTLTRRGEIDAFRREDALQRPWAQPAR